MEKRDLEIQMDGWTDGQTHTHDDYSMPWGSAHRGINIDHIRYLIWRKDPKTHTHKTN